MIKNCLKLSTVIEYEYAHAQTHTLPMARIGVKGHRHHVRWQANLPESGLELRGLCFVPRIPLPVAIEIPERDREKEANLKSNGSRNSFLSLSLSSHLFCMEDSEKGGKKFFSHQLETALFSPIE